MRDKWMARFVILPFSVGCASHSSVAVHENRLNRAQAEAFPATIISSGDAKGQSTGMPKNSFGNLSFHKLVKSFKNLSNYFAFEEEEEEEEDEDEVEMEIGFPTDVQHVTHIGLDGLSRLDKASPELLSLPSFPLKKQFELALAAQTGAPPPPVGGSHGSWLL